MAHAIPRPRSPLDQVSSDRRFTKLSFPGIPDLTHLAAFLSHRWRFFLPEKWRDASAPNHDGILDPNLVLAHLTHNTAVIQLHQAVAFKPSKVQPFSVELPQASSLQTCLAAANEIGTIALHFLDQEAGIVSPQVAVCLFIAARSLLTHSKVCQLPVSASFDTLSAALQRVSERWSSSQAAVAQDGEVRPLLPLASRLSERLAMAKKSLHTVGEVPLAMSIEQPVYSGHAARSRANSIGPELEHDIPGQPPRRQHKSSTQHGETPAYEGAADQAGLKPSVQLAEAATSISWMRPTAVLALHRWWIQT